MNVQSQAARGYNSQLKVVAGKDMRRKCINSKKGSVNIRTIYGAESGNTAINIA